MCHASAAKLIWVQEDPGSLGPLKRVKIKTNANVGHAALVQYLNTQVGAIDVRSDKQRAQWRLGIGPWVGLPEASGVRFSWVEVSQERPNISN